MRMYVTNSDNDTVSVIDTNNNTVISSIVVGSGPQGIAYDSKHMRMYVTNLESNSVSAIDTNTNTVLGNPIVVGSGPQGIAYDSKHMRMYVTNFGSNSVSAIDTNTNTVVSEGIKIDTPLGITYDLLNSKLYVTSIGGDTIVAIDSRSNAIVGNPVPSGGNPTGLSLDYKNGKVFASNHANATVSAIQITPLRTLITSVFDGRNESISDGGQTSSGTVTFDFSATSLRHTKVQAFQCKIDASPTSRCSSPISYEGLEANRTHTFSVQAIDELGSIEMPPAEFNWTITTSSMAVTGRNSICSDVGPTVGSMDEIYDGSPQLNTGVNERPPGAGCIINGISTDNESRDTLNNRGQDINPTDFPSAGLSNSDHLIRDQKKDKMTRQLGENSITCLEITEQFTNLPDTEFGWEFPCGKGKFNDQLVQEGKKDVPSSSTNITSRLEENAERNIQESPSGNIPLALPF